MLFSKGRKSILLAAGSMIALSAFAVPTFAQEANDSGDVVIVTGQRAQVKSAQKIKKDSDVIVDSVTAVDIGALPDRSVSEALQRISGLTIQRTNENRDPGRMAAEGGAVQIRGLSWVRSETNGRDIFSAKSGRALSWEDVSADLLGGIDVYKNTSADMIEGGIGGTVNLKMRLPFDSKKRILALNVDRNYGDLQEKAYVSYSGIYSDRFDTKFGEIGLLLNYSVSETGNRTDSINVDRFETTAVGTRTVYVPASLSWKSIDWNQKRTAASMALQWKPSDQWLFTLSAMDAKVDAENIEYGIFGDGIVAGATATGSDYVYDSDGIFVSGTVPDSSYGTDSRYGEDHKQTTDLSFNAKWWATDKLSFNLDAQYVKSTAKILSMTAYTAITGGTQFAIDLSGDLPSLAVQGTDTSDASLYAWAAAMDHIEDNEGQERAYRLDGRYDFDDDKWIKSFKFGVRSTDKDYITRESGWNWNLLSYQYWGDSWMNPAYINDTTGTYPDSSATQYRSFDNFFRGNANAPGTGWFPAASVVSQGTAHAYSILKSTENQGWGWTPLTTDWDNYSPAADNISGGVNRQSEKTDAAYLVGTYKFDNFMGDHVLDGNFGARVVKTQNTANGFVVMSAKTIANACVVSSTITSDMCTLATQAATFASTSIKEATPDASAEYTNILPSFNIRYKHSDTLQFRFAVSQAMVRPELYQTNAYTSLSVAVDSATYVTTLSGVSGNPNLRPIQSTQYDITGEWYFAPTGSLTVDFFKKDIKDYVYGGSEIQYYTNNGVTLPFNITRYVNGSKGKVDGFEIAYSQFYDFLPGAWSGLGIQANYTLINSDGGHNPIVNIFDNNQIVGMNLDGLPLEGMSPESYNFALMYEKYGISARMAYNWRDTYLLTTSGANINRPVWSEAYGQWDGSIFYTLNDHYKVGLQATNIGRANTYLLVSNIDNLNVRPRYSWVATDRRVALVLRASF